MTNVGCLVNKPRFIILLNVVLVRESEKKMFQSYVLSHAVVKKQKISNIDVRSSSYDFKS